ncbi:MAG: hypothetical protein IPL50_06720 [Chitinophagaceae bacterium]|nr:hypothetical protein [Chitinophagaceae bacterium]
MKVFTKQQRLIFLYKAERKNATGRRKRIYFMFRPSFITAVLSVILVLNIFSLKEMNKASKQNSTSRSENPSGIESFAKVYNLNTGSVYE